MKLVPVKITQQSAKQPITAERIERALDHLAEIIVQLGEGGAHYLPIYERLENELAAMKAQEAMMERVRERARVKLVVRRQI